MAIYWVTEALPMGLTGLLPVILFPLFGIASIPALATNYFKNIHLLIVGTMMIAVAIEKHGLHKRVALRALLLIGTSPRRLLIGVMFTSWFLSFWLPNIATVAMMVPIVDAVIRELTIAARANFKDLHTSTGDSSVQVTIVPGDALECPSPQPEEAANDDEDLLHSNEHLLSMAAMMTLATSYACNIGGTATLIGTNPNMLLQNLMDDLYTMHGKESPLTYATWIPMGLPGATLAIVACFIWLQIYFSQGGCLSKKANRFVDVQHTRIALTEQYEALGPISFAEVIALLAFFTVTLLFFFRDPGFMPGYKSLFENGMVTDAVPALAVGALLFVLPAERPKIFCCRGSEGASDMRKGTKSVPAMLEWRTTIQKLPWSALFLIGGALAMEMGSRKSGLSLWLGCQLCAFDHMAPWAVVLIGMLFVCFFTQVTCGMATSSVFLPLFITMADRIGIHPLYITAPATLIASSTFMLPASSPTNAIIYETGHIPIKHMIVCGFVMNLIFAAITLLGTETWIKGLFDLDTLPWPASNTTAL
ncbi:hypothetical protein CAPTEDRAFT_166783 [Capitella teleta]|uniref:Citrate transporter-like domain-containing protein n=1 Tax=Capitella teleta TaxID=283909 RepID=R7TD72_CAPTE|nr:hypothetical protein CAPTEDRAFT_166783 [Capitella teleta]|eukprot:ELT91674.1 hypothetical protein CAPTEDRAFT_166783 [Capitella teleta]